MVIITMKSSLPKVVKKLRLDVRKKVESEKVQEEGSNKKSKFISRPEARKIPQTTPKALARREKKSSSMNEVNASVQE
ncbi:hypothetical protein LguiA_018603 [Lonicera macranthoides]